MMKIKKDKKSKIYMGPDVDAAIVEYNAELDSVKRNIIYNKKIKQALEKLAENILNNWKFPYLTESFKNKKAELMSHFILNLDKYSPEKGSAFTYFTYAGRNYLIIHNNYNYGKIKCETSINNDTSDETNVVLQVEDHNILYDEMRDDKRELIVLITEFFEKNVNFIFKKKADILIAHAILQLLQNYEDIENFNKKNIYILIREMTNSRAQNITKVLNKMKEIYITLIVQYIENGEIKMEYKRVKNSTKFFK